MLPTVHHLLKGMIHVGELWEDNIGDNSASWGDQSNATILPGMYIRMYYQMFGNMHTCTYVHVRMFMIHLYIILL